MSDRESVFKKMDTKTFQLIDKYKASNIYAQYAEQVSSLSALQQRVLGQFLNLSTLLVPIVTVVVLFYLNNEAQKEVSSTKDILKYSEMYLSNKNLLENQSQKILSPFKYNSQQELESRLTSAVRFNTKENAPIVKIIDFQQEDQGEFFTKTTAYIEFSNLSSKLFTNLLKELVLLSKSKISSLSIQKDIENKFIRGNLEFTHYGKK